MLYRILRKILQMFPYKGRMVLEAARVAFSQWLLEQDDPGGLRGRGIWSDEKLGIERGEQHAFLPPIHILLCQSSSIYTSLNAPAAPCALSSLAASNQLIFTQPLTTAQSTSLPILSLMFPAFHTGRLQSPCTDLCSGFQIPSLISG